jgi:hypothetical protein
MAQIAFSTQSYLHRSLPVSAQRCVNLYSEAQPQDAKTPVALLGTPGLVSFATPGSGPIRGLATMDGLLYAVSGAGVYKIASDGTATLLGSMSTSTGTVSMDASASQLVIVTNPAAYVATSSTLTQITDPDFPSAATVSYLDGYHVFTRPDTQTFFISDLLNALSLDSLDFASAESAPDDLLRVLVDHREVWLFGERSTEVWVNTGAAVFPFERQPGSILERGTAAAFSPAKMDNSVYWLGDDRIIYRAEGYSPRRVSTHAIEQAISGYATVSDAFAFTYSQDGHHFYVLTFPTALATWVFDVATGLWHERDSRASDVSIGRWRASSYAYAYGKHLVGDYSAGVVWEMDSDIYTEGTEDLVRTACSPPIHADGARAFMSRLELDMETGVGLSSGQGSDPQAMLSWSDDGGRTWTSEAWAPLGTNVSLGGIGVYRTRVKWQRLGTFRQRVLKVSISDPVRVTILSAHAEIAGGLL